jgi:hypothetical protein
MNWILYIILGIWIALVLTAGLVIWDFLKRQKN